VQWWQQTKNNATKANLKWDSDSCHISHSFLEIDSIGYIDSSGIHEQRTMPLMKNTEGR